jgi:hypothetical protein
MPTIFTPTEKEFQLTRSQKTSFPKLRHLPAGVDVEDIAPGEFVGRNEAMGAREELVQITSGNYEDQQLHALMRVNTTSNDSRESGAITVQKGHFEAKTKFYLEGETYNVGDLLTLRFSPTRGCGVLGPVEGSTQAVVGKVESAPINTAAGQQDMMAVTIFDNPVPTANALP